MVFHWTLSDCTSPQVSFYSILVDLSNAVVWMVLVLPMISSSSSTFSKPLGTVLSTPATIDMVVTFMFYNVFSSLARSKYLSLFLFSLIFTQWSAGWQSSQFSRFSFFLLIITRSGLLVGIRWSVCISKSKRILCILFTRTDGWTDSDLCMYYLLVWSNFNFLHNSQWITFFTLLLLLLLW